VAALRIFVLENAMSASQGAVRPEEPLLLERPRKGVALLRLNRPVQLNALNMSLRESLARHFRQLEECTETRVIVMTGNAQAFAAGADLGELAEASVLQVYQRHVERYWQAISACRKPIIAAVNGYALGGGCELAMHCDLIVAGTSASFAQPEIRVGVMPGAGGTQRLLRAVGKYQALRMLLTGCRISAAEALAIGLVSEVVDDEQVLPRALELAGLIAGMPPLALAQIKEVVLAGMDMPLEQALVLERKAFQLLFDSRDQKEGMRAFLEKRKPEYLGQ
jgi:enoyl-CoA hydratase/carnithine racemase